MVWVEIGKNIPIHSPVLRLKTEKNSLNSKHWIHTLSEWCDQFRKCAGLSCRSMTRESRSVIEEEVADASVLQPMNQVTIRPLKHKCHRHLVCKFLQRITTIRACCKISVQCPIHTCSILKWCQLGNDSKALTEGLIVWSIRTSQWRRWLKSKSTHLGQCFRKW